MIYQVHPDHGKHFAQNMLEAKQNEKNGWKTVTEEEFYSDCYPAQKPEKKKKVNANGA